MKTRGLIFILSLLMCSTQMQGQFLKKLKKKIEQVTEDVIINKTSEKVGQSVDQTLDGILGLDGESIYEGKIGSLSMGDASLLPDTYFFTWKYKLQVETTKSDPTEITYYLMPDKKYFGMQPNLDASKNTGDMFMVMDIEHNVNAIFISNKNQKTGMVMKMSNDLGDFETDDHLENDYTFEEIEDKVINGKNCKGFKMENEETIMTMYNDMDAPISFSNIFGVNTKNVPKGFNPKWLDKVENSLVMEMNYTDKKNKQTTSMRCIELVEHSLEISKKDYKFTSLGQPNKD